MQKDKNDPQGKGSRAEDALPRPIAAGDDSGGVPPHVTISYQRRDVPTGPQRDLWEAIRLHTELIGFNHFAFFVERGLGRQDGTGYDAAASRPRGNPADHLDQFKRSCDELKPFGGYIPGTDLYGMLKLAAEMFLLLRCGVCRLPEGDPVGGSVVSGGNGDGNAPDIFKIRDGAIPADEIEDLNETLTGFLGRDRGSYINAIIRNVFGREGFGRSPFAPVSIGLGPCLLELLWSYWHEEAMLAQTTNAIALRFQNVARRGRDPLVELELDPLRPLSGFMWGYIQDETNRLSPVRRQYEYRHAYGFDLAGRSGRVRPADSRSKFLQAFHDLLRLTDQFYREAADNTVTPDPFPLLIALRDLHMILAEGAHNQFRDLPWTARAEMLVQQWMLARPEIREFLRGRQMTPYPEGWMGAVDSMKRLQGWSDTNAIHFSDLAKFGERLLLSVRHVRWDSIADPFAAQDWALSWRPEIQGYIHAYRIVTGVMLSDDVVEVNRPGSPRYVQPSRLLAARLSEQRRALGVSPAAPSERLLTQPRQRSLPR